MYIYIRIYIICILYMYVYICPLEATQGNQRMIGALGLQESLGSSGSQGEGPWRSQGTFGERYWLVPAASQGIQTPGPLPCPFPPTPGL